MIHGNDWIRVLDQIRDNLQKAVAPNLGGAPQPPTFLGVGAGGDPIEHVDLAAEKAIVATLEKRGLSFTLISEESGIREYGANPDVCYVTADPVDGSANVMRNIPFAATSIAISASPRLSTVHAALVEDLVHHVTYVAETGRGAFRNGHRVGPSGVASPREAMIGLDLNTDEASDVLPLLTGLIGKTRHLRHFGANALEICYVADGSLDAFVDVRGKLRATDVAAAWLIVKEAGARITDPAGNELDFELSPTQKVDFVAAGNARLHKTILDLAKARKSAT